MSEPTTYSDRDLGMDRRITRRDFLDGVAMSVAVAGLPRPVGTGPAAAGETAAPGANPSRTLGDRGQQGANAVAHALRDGTFWRQAGTPHALGESYDLVVVGGGISGLAAALEYRRRVGAGARILILEALDDFGGHAKRNEFVSANGRVVLGHGGSQSLQTPSYFSPAVADVVRSVGIDLERFETEFYDRDWRSRHALGQGVFFARETFGTDRLVRESGRALDWVPSTPLPEAAQRDLIALLDAPRDYLPALDRTAKRRRLAAATYREFLLDIVGADPKLVDYFSTSTVGYFGAGIDAVSALDACANGNPGFAAMDLGDAADPAMSPSGRLAYTDPDEYIYHFPDGNYGLARALVRTLMPRALPGTNLEDLVTARADYAQLDSPASPVRVRLQSTAVRVRHRGAPDSGEPVDVAYVRQGRLESIETRHVVLACWHRMIPYLCEDLPSAQLAALGDQCKVPLVYTNVLLRDWSALKRLGVHTIHAPAQFWSETFIDFPVSMGRYRFAERTDEPIVLHMGAVPLQPGLSPREQAAAGRRRLAGLSFGDLERSIREQLTRALSAGGFDPARDIEGICANRWSHGYAYEYMRPWDAYWPDGPLPIFAARERHGRIAIANADSGAYAYAHSAIDQGIRAVRELVGAPAGAPAIGDFPGPPRALLGFDVDS
jgi:spermidine dehydrogenase